SGKTVEREYYFMITFPEGFTVYQIAGRLEEYHVCSRSDFLNRADQLISDSGFKDKYSIPKEVLNMEGFLFPDTYRVKINYHPDYIISMMLNRFNQIFSSSFRKELTDSNKNFYEVLIIASLIEKETGYNEHDLISSVIYNRLQKWYMLQIDATILYALGPDAKNITRQNKLIKSPYNTYTKYGLPPTPICNPGKKSILAAINPAKTTYLYYVSKNDGTHVFSNTYKEHQKNVNKYQKGR
ncbi:MAG: endolytic transglycosylase MltG, partial [bacterium]|nr:endolytic transglycosylase MltG [bacterium]